MSWELEKCGRRRKEEGGEWKGKGERENGKEIRWVWVDVKTGDVLEEPHSTFLKVLLFHYQNQLSRPTQSRIGGVKAQAYLYGLP